MSRYGWRGQPARAATALTAAVTIGLVILQWTTFGVEGWRAVVGSSLVVAALTATVALGVEHRSELVGPSLLLGASPMALSGAASGRLEAVAVAVALSVVLVVPRDRLAIRVAGVAVTAIGVAVWWLIAATGDGYSPTWAETVRLSADMIRLSWFRVDPGWATLPPAAVLAWWVGLGVVAGSALAHGAWRACVGLAMAWAAFLFGGWIQVHGGGGIDASRGAWLVAVGIALVGGCGPMRDQSRRSAALLVAGAAAMTGAGGYVEAWWPTNRWAAFAAGTLAAALPMVVGIMSVASIPRSKREHRPPREHSGGLVAD